MKSFEQIEREALEEGQAWIRKRIEEKIQEEEEKSQPADRSKDGLFPPPATPLDSSTQSQD